MNKTAVKTSIERAIKESRESKAEEKQRAADVKVFDQWVPPELLLDVLDTMPYYYETSVASTGSYDLFVRPKGAETCGPEEVWIRTFCDVSEGAVSIAGRDGRQGITHDVKF